MNTRSILITSLFGLSFITACSDHSGPASRGTGLRSLILADGVEGFDYLVTQVDCATGAVIAGGITQSAHVNLLSGFLPDHLTAFINRPFDANSEHQFTDAFFTLPAGCYDVLVTPFGPDADSCSQAELRNIEVVNGETTERLLISQCEGLDPGALDLLVALNHDPVIEELTFPTSKFLTCYEGSQLCVRASDPDADPLRFAIEFDPGVECTASDWVLGTSPDPAQVVSCTTITCTSGGSFVPHVRVYDQAYNGLSELVDIESLLADHGAIDGSGGVPTSHAELNALIHVGCETCGPAPAEHPGPSNPDCEVAPSTGTFEPVIEWSKNTWTVAPNYNQVMAAPIVVSLTDDNGDSAIDENDVPDIVFTTFTNSNYASPGYLRAVSGDSGAEILNIGGEGIHGSGGVAGGDIDGDGIVELVTVTTAGEVKVFEHDGTLKWATAALGISAYSYPAIADLDNDGQPEIIAGNKILNHDGTVHATLALGTGSLAAVVANVDADPEQEVIAGNAIYAADGSAQWSGAAMRDGWVAVADINGDGQADVVVVDGEFVRVQSITGTILWASTLPGGGGGPPTVADYDGDGQPEVGVAGRSNYVVFEPDGTILWQKPTQDASSQQTGSSVFDFEGDGAADVIYNDELFLRVYSGVDGTEKLKLAGHGSGTLYEYPIVVDVDHDGQSEIVVVNNDYVFGTTKGVTVYGDLNNSWRPTRGIWNQHAYSITNVNDDGSIPTNPVPNHTVYNNFRSGDLAPPDGTKTPDLTLEIPALCRVECSADKVVLWVHVGNEGASPLTAGGTLQIDAVVAGTPVTLDSVPLGVINPGTYTAAYAFEIDPTGLESITIHVEAFEQECNELNNDVIVLGVFCPLH